MIWLYLFLFAGLKGYRECQILVDRGSWREEMFWIPFWTTDWQSIWKNFDSFHFIEGLFALVMVSAFTNGKKYQWWYIPIFWLVYYHFRNLFIHIIYRTEEVRQWDYLWGNLF